jgi:hypothetical protein
MFRTTRSQWASRNPFPNGINCNQSLGANRPPKPGRSPDLICVGSILMYNGVPQPGLLNQMERV